MQQPVDDVLAERRQRDGRRLSAGLVALAGHVLLAAAVALAPAFAARRNDAPRDFMRVMIVPAKALGDTTVVEPPRRAEPKKPSAAVAAPKPEVPKRTVEKETEPRPAPERVNPSPARPPSPEVQGAEESPSQAGSTARRGGPDGTAFGTSPFGSSEASLDDPNFQYGYYVQQMLALIGQHWVRPRSSPGTSMVIHFNITRRGELEQIEVVTESGNRAFDLAGYRAVALASPLPPLPQSYQADSLGVNLLIR